MRKLLIWTLATCLMIVGLTYPTPDVSAQSGATWTALYFANRDWNPPATASRIDSSINFNWGLGAPFAGMPVDDFSVRWASSVYFTAGRYRFATRADDYVRLTVNSRVVLDTFESRQVDELVVAEVDLSEGYHNLILDYQERTGPAFVSLEWTLLQARPEASSSISWFAEYYDNTTLSGSPSAILTESTPSHNWGNGSPVPSVSADNFSARWTGTVNQPGQYLVNVEADDGVRVYVDGQLIINEWHSARAETYSATFTVTNPRTVQVEYFEAVGLAILDFDIVNLDTTDDVVWTAEYYNNRNLSGSPVLRVPTLGVSNQWGTGNPAPGVRNDDFSVRWTSVQNLTSGFYRVRVNADDGVRVYVDGQMILDEWHLASANTYEAGFPINRSGDHVIVVEYFESGGAAFIDYEMSTTTAPPSQLVPRANATITAPRLNVRAMPSTTAEIVQRVEGGGVYGVVGKNADSTWWQILVGGQTGWVFGTFVNIDNPAAVPVTNAGDGPDVQQTGITGRIAVDVNVRSQPSTRGALLDVLRTGTTVNLVGRNSSTTWIQIEYRGIVGWILRSTLQPVGNSILSQLPVR